MFRKLVIAGLLLGSAAGANAAVIFDNFKGTGATSYYQETRNSSGTFGTVAQFTANTTISGLGVRYQVLNGQDIKFMIFDSALGGTFNGLTYNGTGALLYSQTKTFSATATLDYIYADPFSFTFLAGRRYDIGILGSNGQLLGSWDIQNGSGNVNTTIGAVTTINRNANFQSFGAPTTGDYAGVDPHIQLLAADEVPEPAMLGLFGLGAIALVASRRRRA